MCAIKFLFLTMIFLVVSCNPKINQMTVEFAGTPRGGDFSIPSTIGEFKTNNFRGEILFIFFGFSHCPYICPTTLKNLSVMKKKLRPEEQKRVRILFVSVDNERDTVDSLRSLNELFGDRIISATDTDHNLREIAIRFGAGFSKRKNKFGDWIIDHTDKVYVINSKGEWVTTKPYNVSAAEFKEAFDVADKLTPVGKTSQHRKLDVWGSNLDCDLSQGPCSADVGGEKVSLSINPIPIQVSKPLSLEFKSKNLKALEIDFLGFEENMGFLRPQLSSQDDLTYRGEITLPVCDLEEMTWNARVLVKNQRGEGVILFSFKTQTKI